MVSEWKARVIQGFDRGANTYDDHNDVQEQVAASLADALPDVACQDILEIGCGTGTMTAHLFDRYPEARFCMTDVSSVMIEKAQRRFSAVQNTEWRVMDGEHPDMDRKFDLIVSNMAFQWFEHPEVGLNALQSLLKPSGVLLFSVPSHESFPEWRSTLSALSVQQGFDRAYDWPNVFKTDDVVIDYSSTLNFLKHFKSIGASVPDPDYELMRPSLLRRACVMNDEQYGGHVTWRIVYGCLKAV